MHHAFYLGEILLIIFTYCSPRSIDRVVQRRRCTADLAALARTCRTFKEPALNRLWAELVDLSPLVRCLPEVCKSAGRSRHDLKRPLNEAEWNTLRGYTRRVRAILGFSSDLGSLADDAIKMVFNPPFTESLFPNLRSLCRRDVTYLPVKHLTSPLLTSLTLDVHPYREDECSFRHFLDSAAELCPNMKQFRIHMSLPPPSLTSTDPSPFDSVISRHVCRWTNLDVVDCHNVELETDAFIRLSSVSSLTWLSFSLTADLAGHILGLDFALIFPSLAHLEILSGSLLFILGLFSHVQLPAVQVLIAKVTSQPLKQTVEAYSTAIQNACPSDTLMHFKLLDIGDATGFNRYQEQHHQLTLNDIRPCTVFINLRGIHISFRWSVNLTDTDLLALASASPRIEHLIINDMWGWRTRGGVTLAGLVQLLRTCPSLYDFCLALDTRTFTQIPRGLDVSFPARPRLWMNVADSRIYAEDVRALVFVFTELKLDPVVFMAWNGSEVREAAGAWDARNLWGEVYHQAKTAFMERALISEMR